MTSQAAHIERRRRRDRRGRGLRGPLGPQDVPVTRTRADRFDDLVLDAVEQLEPRWGTELAGVDFAVEDVPPDRAVATGYDPVPLGRTHPATTSRAARIVVYRRPIETRAADATALAGLVLDVVIEQVADLLGLAPESIDPDYRGPDSD